MALGWCRFPERIDDRLHAGHPFIEHGEFFWLSVGGVSDEMLESSKWLGIVTHFEQSVVATEGLRGSLQQIIRRRKERVVVVQEFRDHREKPVTLLRSGCSQEFDDI